MVRLSRGDRSFIEWAAGKLAECPVEGKPCAAARLPLDAGLGAADVPRPSLTLDLVFANVPDGGRDGDFFRVPR